MYNTRLLIARLSTINTELSDLDIKKRKLLSEIKDIKLFIHGMLIEAGFYDFSKLSDEFEINKSKLPYQDCGEGDYKNIEITLEDGDNQHIEIVNFCSYDSNTFVAKLPLEWFNDQGTLNTKILGFFADKNKKLKDQDRKEKQSQLATLKAQIKNLEKELDKN